MTVQTAAPDQDLIWRQKAIGTPADVLGANLAMWLQSDRGTGVSAGDPVVSWINQVANGNAVQGGNTAAPILQAESFGAKPGVSAQAGDQGLVLTLTTPLAIGARPYLWLLGRLNAIRSVDEQQLVFISKSPDFIASITLYAFGPGTFQPNQWDWAVVTDGFAETAFQQELDTDAHLFQGAVLQAGAFVFDGNPKDAPVAPGPLTDTCDTVWISNSFPAGAPPGLGGLLNIGVLVLSYDQPTPTQIEQVAEYCATYPHHIG